MERRQPWLQALRPAAASQTEVGLSPAAGRPCPAAPGRTSQESEPRFTLCMCPPRGSAFWDVVVADSGQHSVSKARSLTESAEQPAGQTEWVTRTPGLQASPSAPPVPAAVPSLFPGGPDGKESTCSAGDPDSPLGGEDPLEEGMATHSSIPASRIPWTEEPGGLHFMELQSQTRQSMQASLPCKKSKALFPLYFKMAESKQIILG